MGLLARWGLARDVATAETVVLPPTRGDVAQVSHLPTSVAEAFGINLASDRVSRDQAMSIPAMRQGRQVIAGTLGTAPLIGLRRRAGRATERVERQLLTQPDPDATCAYTLTWTYDDLLFHGVSWWRVLDRDGQGYPARAERLALGRVVVDTATGRVRVDGKLTADKDLIRFDGPDEGVLKHGARTLRTCLLLEDAVRRYAVMDVPLGFFEDQETQMEDTEVQEFLDSWEKARRARSTGYVPKGLEYKTPGFNAEQMQLAEARGYQSAEVARLLNLRPSGVNAPSNDSLTYSTTEGDRRQLIDLTYRPFIASVEQRLSMPDVTPAGTTVAVDLTSFSRGDTKTVLEAAKVGIDAGVLLPDEVRTDWLNLPPLEGTTDE